MHLRNIFLGILAAASLALPASAATFAGWPPPGGAGFTPAGNPVDGGGTWTIHSFDPSAWDQLWWGHTILDFAMDGSVDTPSESLALASMSGAIAVFEGVTSILAGTVYTRMVAEIVSGGSDWIDPTSVGIIDPTMQAASEVDGSVPFVLGMTVTASFTYDAGGVGYDDYLPFFDDNTGFSEDGNAISSYGGAFYYTAAVPLPAGLPLLAMGLAGLWAVRRRNKS